MWKFRKRGSAMKTYKGMEYITLEEMEEYGYDSMSYGNPMRMIPLTKEQALLAYNNGLSLFRLYSNGTESYIDNEEEFQDVIEHGLMFGLEIEDDEDWLEKLYVELNEKSAEKKRDDFRKAQADFIKRILE